VLITNEFHEFYRFIILGTSDDGKGSYGSKSIHIFIISKTRGNHRQYDTRGQSGTKLGPSRAKVGLAGPTSFAGRPGFGVFLKSVFSTCQLKSARRVSNVGKAVLPQIWPSDQVKESAGLTSGPPEPKLHSMHRVNPPINTLLLLHAEGVKKMRFSPL
jgi:hypothetical protein